MNTVLLRAWRDEDLPDYIALNADRAVMRYFPAPYTPDESRASFERLRTSLAERGWGVWVVEVNGEFAGVTGLSNPRFESAFTPCTEILWRLRPKFWGKGVSVAAARHALAFGFDSLQLPELVAFTAECNLPSRRLMERLGFSHVSALDFLHPALPDRHPLQFHVFYRLTAEHYRTQIITEPTISALRP